MPWAHRPGAPRSLRASRPPAAAATDPSRGSGWPGAGRGGPRPARCRGGGAGPGPASTPGSPPARTSPTRGTCRRGRGPRSRDSATTVEKIAWAVAPGASVTRQPEAEDRIQHRADRVRQRAPVDDRDRRADRPAAAEEAGAVRFVLDDARRSAPSTAATCAAQIGGSSAERGRRVASRAPISGTNSVCDEQVLEGRVGDVGGLRREHDLGVRRQLDLAGRASRGWSATRGGSRRRARPRRRWSGRSRSSRRGGENSAWSSE